MRDEVEDRSVGIGRWIDDRFLTGPKMTIFLYDGMLPWVCNLEVGMAMQNLMPTAMALRLRIVRDAYH